MIEKRRYHRIRFKTRCLLKHDGLTYQGQVENISLGGALISFSEGIIVPQGEKCTVLIYLDGEEAPFRFLVETVHSGFSMIGVNFCTYDAQAKVRLYALMERVTTEPDKLRKELEFLQP